MMEGKTSLQMKEKPKKDIIPQVIYKKSKKKGKLEPTIPAGIVRNGTITKYDYLRTFCVRP